MSARLAGKRVLIYGGGSGIGLACARAMATAGAAVFLSGRRVDTLAAASQTVAAGAPAGFAAGDATQEQDVMAVTSAARQALGGLDTIVISSGAGGITPIFTTTCAEFQRICDANLLPVFLASRYGAEHLLAAGSGSIIAIASMYGLVGQRERSAYCAAKAAVIGLIKSMALDFAEHGIRANAICPGFIETELSLSTVAKETDPEASLRARRLMHPIPRPGRVEEVASLAVYLASEESAWTTGQAIAVDGGYTAR